MQLVCALNGFPLRSPPFVGNGDRRAQSDLGTWIKAARLSVEVWGNYFARSLCIGVILGVDHESGIRFDSLHMDFRICDFPTFRDLEKHK